MESVSSHQQFTSQSDFNRMVLSGNGDTDEVNMLAMRALLNRRRSSASACSQKRESFVREEFGPVKKRRLSSLGPCSADIFDSPHPLDDHHTTVSNGYAAAVVTANSNCNLVNDELIASRMEAFLEARKRTRVSRELLARATMRLATAMGNASNNSQQKPEQPKGHRVSSSSSSHEFQSEAFGNIMTTSLW
jgi:hypothetical protein